ncbi:MAG: CoA-binding protein [Candidatus Hadarchaeales archaeon]
MTLPKKIAVVGASPNREKWGWRIYNKLKSLGFDVFPVNPNYPEIDGEKCYSSLKDLPVKPDLVITVVPPRVTEKIVEECRELGITKVWMQPGSESERAIEFCRANGIEATYNACFVVDFLGESW